MHKEKPLIKQEGLSSVPLFVYGTLRPGGPAAHYLQGLPILKECVRLKGYALYDAGWYPFAVRASADSAITGDIFEVRAELFPELDAYEGKGYIRHFLEDQQTLIYLKADQIIEGLPKVPNGDWLSWWEKKKGIRT